MFCLLRKVSRQQSAAALLESTLVIPFLLSLIIGLVFISIKLQARALITNVTQEAARLMARENDRDKKMSRLDNLVVIAPKALDTVTKLEIADAVASSHFQVYNLLKAMNDRDPRFRISNIVVSTEYTPGPNDKVDVRVEADVQVRTILSNSILESLGLISDRVTSHASQPYLLTVSP